MSTRDWLPGTRTGQLTMAHIWVNALMNNTTWGVPEAMTTKLKQLFNKASETLEMAQTSDRNMVANQMVRTAFGELTDHMRDLRRVPLNPEELTASHFTRRKRDLIEFPYDNSGKQCFICVRYENGKGDKGPWGPMTNSFIP